MFGHPPRLRTSEDATLKGSTNLIATPHARWLRRHGPVGRIRTAGLSLELKGSRRRFARTYYRSAPGVILITLLLGGASNPSSTYVLLLTLACVPILAAAILRRRSSDGPSIDPILFWLVAALSALLLLHLLPLPPMLWKQLPGRDLAITGLSLINAQNTWLPLTLHPVGTTSSGLGLLPAATVAIVALRSNRMPQIEVGSLIVAFTLFSLLIGLLQVSGSAFSSLYIHSFTNWGMAVGFFANANHFSTLLLISMPVVSALLHWKSGGLAYSVVRATCITLYGALALFGVYLAQTMAGLVLFPAVFAASLVIALGHGAPWLRRVMAVLPVLVTIVLLSVTYGTASAALSSRFGAEPDSRFEISKLTMRASAEFWPVGSGIGSFPKVYRTFEDPAQFPNRYVNHAHNEYLEIFMEAGILGIGLLTVFIGWRGIRSLDVWRDRDSRELPWKQSSTVIIATIMSHSLVDYPLRTPAIMSIFVFYCLTLADRANTKEDLKICAGCNSP